MISNDETRDNILSEFYDYQYTSGYPYSPSSIKSDSDTEMNTKSTPIHSSSPNCENDKEKIPIINFEPEK